MVKWLLLLCACSKTLNVRTRVIPACDQPSVIESAQSFVLRVEGDGLDTPRETNIAVSAGRVTLGEIPPTTNGRVTLIGDGGLSAGGVGKLDLSGKLSDRAVEARVVMGRVGTFAGTTDEDGCTIMQRPRQGHTATELDDGTVFIAGGEVFSGGQRDLLRGVEIYDPRTGAFTPAADLPEPRSRHTATLVAGKLLLCGGQGVLSGRTVELASCELYDPKTKTYGERVVMNRARKDHTATALADGRVVIIGGGGQNGYQTTVEIYAPGDQQLTIGTPIKIPRSQHTATLLGDGSSILVAGGRDQDFATAIYETWTESEVKTAGAGIARFGHAAARIRDGRVVLAGGYTTVTGMTTDVVEVFDGAVGCGDRLKLSSARGDGFASAYGASVLFGGGVGPSGNVLRDADVVTLGNQKSCQAVEVAPAGAKLKQARSGATATLLSGGDVLIVGGSQSLSGATVPADAGEVFVAPR